jgi:hypothetical protein
MCQTRVRSTRTERECMIRRNYDFQSSWVIYVVTCLACQDQYTGQTRQTMVARHYGHISEIRNGLDELGRHFKEKYGVGLDLSKKEDLARCMEHFHLQLIASVRPPATPEQDWIGWRLTSTTGCAVCQSQGE